VLTVTVLNVTAVHVRNQLRRRYQGEAA
jgi:hypothetical protein